MQSLVGRWGILAEAGRPQVVCAKQDMDLFGLKQELAVNRDVWMEDLIWSNSLTLA